MSQKAILLLACLTTLLRSANAAESLDFSLHVESILANHCYDCHGADEKRRRAELRLDTETAWRTPLPSGRTFVAQGKREQSELWRRITSHDAAVRMPPTEARRQLTKADIETIGRWIDSGGRWSSHWAYRSLRRAEWPLATGTNPIDGFVGEQLRAHGLRPAPEALPEEQLRRVTLTLTGLPPTIAEIDAFLADRSPNRYERVVDRLLASPRFGEHFAQEWLDLARYADTHGYHADSGRDMWRWRDWVIAALNRNQPFDQFTIEQLAGDLLPNPTLDQRIATGFHRNTMINHENGAIPEEYRTEYVMDRVATTGAVWLGQTWLCARCHDHKYDPFSQRDFYRVFAYFNNVPENGLDGRDGNAVPYVLAPTEEQQRSLSHLERQLAKLQKMRDERAAHCETDFQRWQKSAARETSLREPPVDAAAYLPLDEVAGDVLSDPTQPDRAAKISGTPQFVAGKFGQALLFDGETHVELGDALPVGRTAAFTFSAWYFPTSEQDGTLAARVDDGFTARGLTIAWREQRIEVRLCNERESDELAVTTTHPLPLRKWRHLAVSYAGTAKAADLRIYLDGAPVETKTLSDTLRGAAETRRPWLIGRRDKDDPLRGLLDELRLFARPLSLEEIERLAGGDPIGSILVKPDANRSASEREQLLRYFLEHHDGAYQSVAKQSALAQQDLARLRSSIPTSMVMEELPEPRRTFVLERGLYNKPLERVFPGVPEQLAKPWRQLPPNRLGLARWLVDPQNPLTPRVAVNRYWRHCFGRGFVATGEDFGLRGARPSHPELLDYLASELVTSGWDVKHVLRLIVTSDTFRQSSDASAEAFAADPENVWLARGPRVRLSAEAIRDSALAASGLLCERLGGPSVNPVQPANLWRDLAYDATALSAQSFQPGRGSELYRRGLYTFWKRTSPHPLLTTFDAPNRETCVAQRNVSSGPAQSLALLNEPSLVEAHRALAQRIMNDAPADARLEYAFRLVLSRRPTAEERRRLGQLYQEELTYQRALRHADAELYAWTSVAATLLNLEEFLHTP